MTYIEHINNWSMCLSFINSVMFISVCSKQVHILQNQIILARNWLVSILWSENIKMYILEEKI